MFLEQVAFETTNTFLEFLIANAADETRVVDARDLTLVVHPTCKRLFASPAANVIGHNEKMPIPSPCHARHSAERT